MKRSSLKIKDSIMMPPPKARLKSRSDTSEELRKNLLDHVTNTSDNTLQDELNKYLKEHEEIESRKNEEELSISKSTSSVNFDKVKAIVYSTNQFNCNCSSTINLNHNCVNCYKESDKNSEKNVDKNGNNKGDRNGKACFNFNLVNYNYTTLSDDEENVDSLMSLEKLRQNLIQEKETNSISTLNSNSNDKTRNYNFKNFVKLPEPRNKKETKLFVNNMLSYINEHEFDSSLLVLKIKIQTRDNDFKNKGLKFDYYKESLLKMQKELICRICMFHDKEKKVETGKKIS